jgi:hypothetical protein
MPYLVTPVVPPGRMRELEQPVLRAAGGLVLRPWEAGDAEVVLEAYQDPEIQQWSTPSSTPTSSATWARSAT